MDDIDSNLARQLQANGRASFLELGIAVGVSRASAARRVQSLLDSDAIRVIAVRNPSTRGQAWAAHACVDVGAAARPIAHRIASLEGSAFVSLTTGSFGVVVEMRAPDFDELKRRLSVLREFTGVRGVRSMVYHRVLRDVLAPTGPATIEPDGTDLELLTILERDGRRSFAALGNDIGLSANATRVRVVRLLGGGVMHIGAVIRRGAEEREQNIGVGIGLRGNDAALHALIDRTPTIEFAAQGIGRCDVVITVRSSSHTEVSACLESIRRCRSVATVEAWTHLDVIRDVYGTDQRRS